MSDYVSSQKTIELTFDSDIEIITPQLEKIQFTNSGEALLSRPDKLRAHRVGGYSDAELFFNGKTVSIHGKSANAYARFDMAGTVDQLIEALRSGHGVALPGADLLLSNSYEVLIADVVEVQVHGAWRDRRHRMRAPRIPQCGYRLAALGGGWRPAHTAQDGDHEQDHEQRAPVHAPGQEVENRWRSPRPRLSNSFRRLE